MISPIEQVLRSFLAKHDYTWQMHLIQNWRTIVGNLHVRMYLEKIQGDTLVVGVYDLHWMQELFLLHAMLIETINANFDKPYVKQIRFKLAKAVEPLKKKKQVVRKVMPTAQPKLTQRHQKALDAVKDEELKETLYKFLQYCRNPV